MVYLLFLRFKGFSLKLQTSINGDINAELTTQHTLKNCFTKGFGAVPHGVMWMHLYRTGSSSWPAPCEGIDEASYHCTSTCSPKLIQSVPDQTQEKEGNSQNLKPFVKNEAVTMFSCRVCWRSVVDINQQCRQLFQKERVWGCFDYLAVASSLSD